MPINLQHRTGKRKLKGKHTKPILEVWSKHANHKATVAPHSMSFSTILTSNVAKVSQFSTNYVIYRLVLEADYFHNSVEANPIALFKVTHTWKTAFKHNHNQCQIKIAKMPLETYLNWLIFYIWTFFNVISYYLTVFDWFVQDKE